MDMHADCLGQASVTWPADEPTTVAAASTAHMAVDACTRTHMEEQCSSLRVVDPFIDDGVWAIIDDACNSCCHGELWRRNAGARWAELGFKSDWIHHRAISSTGLGRRITTGR